MWVSDCHKVTRLSLVGLSSLCKRKIHMDTAFLGVFVRGHREGHNMNVVTTCLSMLQAHYYCVHMMVKGMA